MIPKDINYFDTWLCAKVEMDLQIYGNSEFYLHLRELLDLDNLIGQVLS